eukprot:m.295772 g.295772  ORF g.295772 m.295772 type:complete len:289 (+) comp20047_c0_seq9:113-979(+)
MRCSKQTSKEVGSWTPAVFTLIVCHVHCTAAIGVQPEIASITELDHLASGPNGGTLSQAKLATGTKSYVSGPPLVLKVSGSREDAAFDQGYLIGARSAHSYSIFMKNLIGNNTKGLEEFLDICWTVLEKQTPAQFSMELDAAARGARAAGVDVDIGVQQRRVIAMMVMPADAPNIIRLVEQELEKKLPAQVKLLINEIVYAIEKAKGMHPLPFPNGIPLVCFVTPTTIITATGQYLSKRVIQNHMRIMNSSLLWTIFRRYSRVKVQLSYTFHNKCAPFDSFFLLHSTV